MKVLLDTNICIAVMRGNARAIARMSALSPADCAISTITAYELFTGVEKCQQPERERLKVEHLLSSVSLVRSIHPQPDGPPPSGLTWNKSEKPAVPTTCFSQATLCRLD